MLVANFLIIADSVEWWRRRLIDGQNQNKWDRNDFMRNELPRTGGEACRLFVMMKELETLVMGCFWNEECLQKCRHVSWANATSWLVRLFNFQTLNSSSFWPFVQRSAFLIACASQSSYYPNDYIFPVVTDVNGLLIHLLFLILSSVLAHLWLHFSDRLWEARGSGWRGVVIRDYWLQIHGRIRDQDQM